MDSPAPLSVIPSPRTGPGKVRIYEKPRSASVSNPSIAPQSQPPIDILRVALVKVLLGFYVALKFLFVTYQLIKTLIQYFLMLITPPWRKSVEGKVVLITGAGHGVGRQLAVMFARRGATVVIWDDNFKGNLDTRYMVELVPAKCYAYTFDLTDEKQVLKAAEEVRQQVGLVYMLINNATTVDHGPLISDKKTSKIIRRAFDVNVLSHFWTIRAFLPDMLKAGQGHIVCRSSIYGQIPCHNSAEYSASKAASTALMASLEQELRKVHKVKSIKLTTLVVSEEPHILRIPGHRMAIKVVCKQILDGILRDHNHIVIPEDLILKLIVSLYGLLPQKVINVIHELQSQALEQQSVRDLQSD